MNTNDGVESFTIEISDEVLADLGNRLDRARFPDPIAGSGWNYGADIDEIRTLTEYWRDGFDWRAQEKRLNAWPHYRTTIDGQSIHFAHIRSHNPDAVPLIMAHGWPGSVSEFLDVAGPLTAPENYGGRPEDSFHLIMPSLPGYGFSEPPRTQGWGPRRIAEAFAELMRRLGYDRYGIQGGDWGAIVGTELAQLDAKHVIGFHTTLPMVSPPAETGPLSEAEHADVADMVRWQREESAYATIQGSRPQSIGVALDDSPAGLCAWIAEKFRAWTDCDGQIENAISRDALLTNITIYWVTRTATSSARLYYELMQHGLASASSGRVSVPTAVARFPKEVARFPRSWLEQRYNIVRWTEMRAGGHFAAMEQPAAFVEDVRAFFASLAN